MKLRAFLILAALLAIAGVATLLLDFRSPSRSQPAPEARESHAPSPTVASTPGSVAPHARAETSAEATRENTSREPALLSGEPALEAISDLSATYDAASVPALARYLGHSDAEIRAAARDGLINLGERAAIPFLEAAAKKAPVEEAKELRDAAEFLALPTWTERRAAERKAKAEASASKP